MQRIKSFLWTAATLRLVPSNGAILPSISNTFTNIRESLLTPSNPLVNQVAGFKLKGIVRRRCKSCYFVVRDGRMHVICKEHPRHKQMAMRPKPHNTWILTHASQSKVRPW